MTVTKILALLRQAGCEPFVEGERLKLKAAPPKVVAKYLCPLQTGIRSVLTRKAWYWMAAPGSNRPTGGVLDPARLIPNTVILMTVQGDSSWDRVGPAWKHDYPELFTTPKG